MDPIRLESRSSRTLFLAFALTGCFSAAVAKADTFNPVITFTTAPNLAGNPTGIAWDGSNYWEVNGNHNFGCTGCGEASYTSTGTVLGQYAIYNSRSIFSDSSGNIYRAVINSTTVQKQTSPGVFTNFLTLTGGASDSFSSTVLSGNELITMTTSGTVYRYSFTSGAFLGSVTLQGYGSVAGETTFPQNERIAAGNGYWFTYANGSMSTWNTNGTRVRTDVLSGVGGGFDSPLSFSFANNLFFVKTSNSGSWRGYEGPALAPVPEPGSVMLMSAGLGSLLLFGLRGRRR